MSSEQSVRVLRTVSELEEIRAAWESWPGHLHSDMGFFLEFLGSNVQSLSPHVIVSYREGRPEAILVGRVDLANFSFRIGYWRFAGPRVRILSFVIGSQRGNSSPQASELLLREALRSMNRGEADAVRLQHVPVDSALYRLGGSLPGVLGRDRSSVSVPHWTMELPGTYEEVLQGFSSRFRRELKQNAKRIQADYGGVELKCFQKPEELEIMFRDVERVAAKSYQRKIGVGFYDTALNRKFMLFHARQGWLLGYVLYVRSEPIAYFVGYLYGGVFCADFVGFDPDFKKYSPGTGLEMRVLEDLCARHAKGIDLAHGDFWWKQRWVGTSMREHADLYMFPITVRGLLLNSVRSASVLVNQSLKAALRRLGALSRIKAAWRERQATSQRVTRQPSGE